MYWSNQRVINILDCFKRTLETREKIISVVVANTLKDHNLIEINVLMMYKVNSIAPDIEATR